MPTDTISSQSTMEEILNLYPSAQRALFRKYHIGGCSSCGFQPTDRLQQVCRSHNITDVESVIVFIRESHELDSKVLVTATEVAESLKAEVPLKLLDIRSDEEVEYTKLPGSISLNQGLVQEILQTWDKETPLVLYCHQGVRSMDAAAYFIGHGFTNVHCLKGGIDAWSIEVDPNIPRYQLAMAPAKKQHLI